MRELETKKAGSFLKTGEIGQVSKVRSLSQIYLIKQIFYCLFFSHDFHSKDDRKNIPKQHEIQSSGRNKKQWTIKKILK